MELIEGLPEWNAGRKMKQVRRELRRRLRASRPPLGKAIREDGRAFITHRFETAGPGRLEAAFHLFRLAWKSDAFLAVLLYRIRVWLEGVGFPILPTLIHRICIAFFDMSIGDYLVFGEGVYVPHGYLVIDGPVVIGRWCVLCPWVTVGLTPGTFEEPELGDGVFVGTGAKILGPVKIGDGAVIGAGSVVIEDVPAHATVAGVPSRVIRDQSHGVEPRSEMP
jgi:serine O-acetyltransferase